MNCIFLANFEKGITTATKKLKQRYGDGLTKQVSFVKRKISRETKSS